MIFKNRFCINKTAFTLAEVLITLGIIGVVAALTLPSLMANYRKHVYYTQFRKAATVIENAIVMYNNDHACGNKVTGYGNYDIIDNLCIYTDNENSAAKKLGSYMNVTKWITSEEECPVYEKGVAINYDGTEIMHIEDSGALPCSEDSVFRMDTNEPYAFITNDGMLINTSIDGGGGNGSIIDVNGAKGPNVYGRDIFIFYLSHEQSHRWGYLKGEYNNRCFDTKNGDNCGIRLLQEGKMNY